MALITKSVTIGSLILMLFSGIALAQEGMEDHFTISKKGEDLEIQQNVHREGAYQIYVIGDSVAWGNGLKQEEKYYFKTAKTLLDLLKVPVEVTVYAHSGAVITDNPDPLCVKEVRFGTGCPGPTLMDQANQISKDADLVLVSGGINDVNIGTLVETKISADEVGRITEQKITKPMTDLLKNILAKNENAKVVVTGYYQLISEKSKLDGVDQQIVKPTLRNFRNDPIRMGREMAMGVTSMHDVSSEEANSKKFYDTSRICLNHAVLEANNGENRVVFVDPKFDASEAYRTGKSLLHPFGFEVSATGHPNPDGATRYADRIREEINKKTKEDKNWLSAKPQFGATTLVKPVDDGSTIMPKPNIHISPDAVDSLDRQIDDAIVSGESSLGELAADQAIKLAKQTEQGMEQGDIKYGLGSKAYENGKYLDASSVKSVDCSGLVIWAYNKAAEGTDVSAEDAPIITTPTDANTIEKEMMAGIVTKDALTPGDLIFLKGTNPDKWCYPNCADHVAIYVGNGNVVHSSTNPEQNVLATLTKGSPGTIIGDKPITKKGYTWLKIEYEDGSVGWSAQEFLVPIDGSFQKGIHIQTSVEGLKVRSTPTTQPTGPYMLSLENFLKLKTLDGKTYEEHIAGYEHVEGADKKVSTAAPKTTPATATTLAKPIDDQPVSTSQSNIKNTETSSTDTPKSDIQETTRNTDESTTEETARRQMLYPIKSPPPDEATTEESSTTSRLTEPKFGEIQFGDNQQTVTSSSESVFGDKANVLSFGIPQNAEEWNSRGIALLNQGNYKEAIEAFNEAISLDPENAAAWNNKGKVLLHQGQDDLAKQCFNIASEIYKNENNKADIQDQSTFEPNGLQLSGSSFSDYLQDNTQLSQPSSGLEGWGKHPKGWGVPESKIYGNPRVGDYRGFGSSGSSGSSTPDYSWITDMIKKELADENSQLVRGLQDYVNK